MDNTIANFYNLNQTEISSAIILFNLVFAFVLCMAIVWVWRYTHRGLSYSQSFAITIVMMGPLAASVMMVVQNNLVGAFALLGAFSLIRFRTIIKETRDVAFLFFALAIGVGAGTGNYPLAIVVTIVISAIVVGLYKFNFASSSVAGFILTLRTDPNYNTHDIEQAFGTYLDRFELMHAKRNAESGEYAYAVHFRDTKHINTFLDKIKQTTHVEDSHLVSGRNAIEY